MGNYKALSDRGKALYGEKPFEADLSVVDEQDLLDAGHVEIVPVAYRVLSNNFDAGEQGDTVDLALKVEQEAALIQGGHIERVTTPVKKKG